MATLNPVTDLSANFSADDQRYMRRALTLAARGLYSTAPNPRVGCVLVQAGKIIGEGWHVLTGGAHAEAAALDDARTAGATLQGASAYVTLEPCAHTGNTPPCADALIAAGITRVVAAMQDPNPAVNGQGFARMRAAGITCTSGLLEVQARALNIGFISRMTRQRPWLRLKAAISLDGKVALADGSARWITGTAARADGHTWRARSCAVLTGIGTVLADDPLLTVRHIRLPKTCRQPWRVIVDSHLRLSPQAKLFSASQGGPILVATTLSPSASAAQPLQACGATLLHLPAANGHVDLHALLAELAARGCNEVLAEAGPILNGALLDAGLVDELLLYQAPSILGPTARDFAAITPPQCLEDCLRGHLIETRRLQQCTDQRLRIRLNSEPAS